MHGLYMEGARWDLETNSIADSRLKELHPEMPVMFLRAVTQDKQERVNIYECPVYKTRERGQHWLILPSLELRLIFSGPTYIWTFNLKTKAKPSKWVLAGVSLLLQI